jgi:hypothetical protein
MRAFVLALTAGAALSAPARAADDPKAVVEKAIKAHGGADNLNKYLAHRATVKGVIVAMGMELELKAESVGVYPDKAKMKGSISVGGMDLSLTQIANGGKLSVKVNGMDIPLDDDRLAEAKAGVYAGSLTQLTPLLKPEFTLKAGGEVAVDGKPAVGVVVSHKDQKDVTLYFDKESGRLVKVARKAKDESGTEVDRETVYSDYKAVDGIQVPHKEVTTMGGTKQQELTVEKYEHLEKVDESEFAID